MTLSRPDAALLPWPAPHEAHLRRDRPTAVTPVAEPPTGEGLAEAIAALGDLRRRCEEAEAVNRLAMADHAQRSDAASRTIGQKQQRIDMLEALLREFRQGLTDLLAEAAQRADDLRRSEAQRQQLADRHDEDTGRIVDLTRRCEDLEKRLDDARRRDEATVAFATLQRDRLKSEEAARAAEARRIGEARQTVERFIEAATPPAPAAPAPERHRLALRLAADGGPTIEDGVRATVLKRIGLGLRSVENLDRVEAGAPASSIRPSAPPRASSIGGLGRL